MDKPLPRSTRVDPKHPCAQLFCSYGLSVGRVRPYPCNYMQLEGVPFQLSQIFLCDVNI